MMLLKECVLAVLFQYEIGNFKGRYLREVEGGCGCVMNHMCLSVSCQSLLGKFGHGVCVLSFVLV